MIIRFSPELAGWEPGEIAYEMRVGDAMGHIPVDLVDWYQMSPNVKKLYARMEKGTFKGPLPMLRAK